MGRGRSLLLGLAAVVLAGGLARRRRPGERVERQLADGSAVTLAAGSAESERLLAAARAGLEAALGS